MDERNIIRIAIKPSAKEAIEKICGRFGMTQQEVASRLYEWLAEQPEAIQVIALKIAPSGFEGDILTAMLERHDSGMSSPAPHPRFQYERNKLRISGHSEPKKKR